MQRISITRTFQLPDNNFLPNMPDLRLVVGDETLARFEMINNDAKFIEARFGKLLVEVRIERLRDNDE